MRLKVLIARALLFIIAPVSCTAAQVEPKQPFLYQPLDEHESKALWSDVWSHRYDKAVELYDQAQFNEAAKWLHKPARALLIQTHPLWISHHTRFLRSNHLAVEAFYSLAQIAYKADDLHTALYYNLKALTLNPHHKPASDNLKLMSDRSNHKNISQTHLISSPSSWSFQGLVWGCLAMTSIILLLMMIGQLRWPKYFSTYQTTRAVIIALSLMIICVSVIIIVIHTPKISHYDLTIIDQDLYSTPGVSRVSLFHLPKGTLIQWSQEQPVVSVTDHHDPQPDDPTDSLPTSTFVKVWIDPEMINQDDKNMTDLQKLDLIPGWLPIDSLMSHHLLKSF